jgi:ABC-type multidrug transport system ATPase subunit
VPVDVRARLRTIRYGQAKRWADAFQGRRDGVAGIPSKVRQLGPAGPVTTPHREALIRLAQEAFAREHLEYSRLVAGPHRRIMAGQARQETAEADLDWARLTLQEQASALSGPESMQRRRLGEEHHPETVIVQRRTKDRHRLLARSQAAVTRAAADVAAIKGELAHAEQEAEQYHQVAVVHVGRIHEHIHRRLAVYRRSLVRAHLDGAWVNEALSMLAPGIPGWALPDAHLPAGAAPVLSEPDPGDPPPAPPADPQTETIELVQPETRFGSVVPDKLPSGVGFVELDDPVAAPWHFTVVKTAGQLELRTRGHGYGPYIDGEPVRVAVLKPGGFFDFANRRYTVFSTDRLEVTSLGECRLVAVDLFARSGEKVRLADMSFVQREKTLLAILGPSGAGKSSLFHALLGELPLESGELFFREMSMATHARQIREDIGFVPQQTDLHESLTVEATLRYGFDLRSANGKKGRETAIVRALKVNKLEEQRLQLLGTLSGGQLRRVSIAMELLTEPALLMLDEPTSGLDPSMDQTIMTFLRTHAEQGHTVLVVTHAPEHLYMAHQVVAVATKGRPAYSGPPNLIKQHFGVDGFADLLSILMDKPGIWVAQYREGQAVKEAKREVARLEQEANARQAAASPAPKSVRGRTPRSALKTFRVLFGRQWVLLFSRALTKNRDDRSPWDVTRNWLVVLLPWLVGAGSAVLAAVVAGPPGLGVPRTAAQVQAQAGPTALALLTTLSVLSGQALTYSDVVSELGKIRREFRVGVGAFQVLATKWLVYSAVAVTQALLITLVFCGISDRGPVRGLFFGPEWDLFLSLAILSVAAMTLGLLVSTVSAKLEHAVAWVTATSITQIALNGITSNLSGSVTAYIAAIFPSRWGVAAAASSIDLRGIYAAHPGLISADALWAHSSGQWFQDQAALGGLTALFFALAVWRLRRRLRLPKPARRKRAGR